MVLNRCGFNLNNVASNYVLFTTPEILVLVPTKSSFNVIEYPLLQVIPV